MSHGGDEHNQHFHTRAVGPTDTRTIRIYQRMYTQNARILCHMKCVARAWLVGGAFFSKRRGPMCRRCLTATTKRIIGRDQTSHFLLFFCRCKKHVSVRDQCYTNHLKSLSLSLTPSHSSLHCLFHFPYSIAFSPSVSVNNQQLHLLPRPLHLSPF